MTGITIEYLLGIYFLVVSLSAGSNPFRINIDGIKFVVGITLILAAFFTMSLI
jgi:hypothetical protein